MDRSLSQGFEDITKYQNCKFKFLDIDNIQAMNKVCVRIFDYVGVCFCVCDFDCACGGVLTM